MASTIPQKRPLEEDETLSESQEQLQSVSNGGPISQPLSTTPSVKIELSNLKSNMNKYQPYISYKPTDFLYFEPHAIESKIEGFYQIDDMPFNTRRGFQYSPSSPNPLLPIIKFSLTELPPFKPTLSYFDRSNATLISEDLSSVTTDRGWVSARASTPIQEGKVYLEFNIIKSDESSHVRIGIGRREASIEAPIGFDGYGYALRDKTGQKVHLSRPCPFMDSFQTGDVIGFLIQLPIMTEFQDITRDQIAIRYRNRLYLEKFDYIPNKKMEHLLNPMTVFGEKTVADTNPFLPISLTNSSITIFKNGKYIGVPFEDLYAFLPPFSELGKNKQNMFNNNGTLGYYPTVSVFNGGIAELNPGPNFKFRPDDLGNDVKDYCELYGEKIAEEIVWDIIDEIEAELIHDSV
ncbi:hypothetical protein WICMUC_000697 [Wickerhamomyces mucosus]|uniref:B30.2/SPRY domain-containing protein n=1 Tax=Wickerhamomyces mucosus TaxID=1378264 RepID=A0A9P8TIE1_9ASCO|nr:hypothetical protein WICMUC_000697 [Wickerhamomyces mucosus]